MTKLSRYGPTVIVASILILINLVALNWSRRIFWRKDNVRPIHYGDRIPSLGGKDYFGNRIPEASPGQTNLIIYLSGINLAGRSITALKASDLLQRENETCLRITLITSGALPEIQELLQDRLISYPIINDSDGDVAISLGLHPGESGTFLFDKSGSCVFATRQQTTAEDLNQLLATQGLANSETGALIQPQGELTEGNPLPAWSVVDVRSLGQTTIPRISSGAQTWVFFVADCFSCGPPLAQRYLADYQNWRKLEAADAVEPVMVFDAAFLRNELVSEIDKLAIKSPAYASKFQLKAVSKFISSKGGSANQPVVVRTDQLGNVASIRPVKEPAKNAEMPHAGTSSDRVKATYLRILQNLGLDVYDVDSYQGSYYASDRTRNCIYVLNDQLQIKKTIGGIGSAAGRLYRPGYNDVSNDGSIYVQDGGNERIQIFGIDGNYLGGFATLPFVGFAPGHGGEVYLGQPENRSLISVYSANGKRQRSIGKLKTYSEVYGSQFARRDKQYRNAINRVRLTTTANGNLLVSFMMAPIIQEYTSKGELVFERRLEGPEIDNLTNSPEGYLTVSNDGFAAHAIAIEAVARPDGGINVVLTNGMIYVADAEGRRLQVVSPRTDYRFTPEMSGVSPAGEVISVGLSPRDCYLLHGIDPTSPAGGSARSK